MRKSKEFLALINDAHQTNNITEGDRRISSFQLNDIEVNFTTKKYQNLTCYLERRSYQIASSPIKFRGKSKNKDPP